AAALRCVPGEAALRGAAREPRARAACTATKEGRSAERRHLAAAVAQPAGAARTQARRWALGRSLDFPGGEQRGIRRASSRTGLRDLIDARAGAARARLHALSPAHPPRAVRGRKSAAGRRGAGAALG